MKRKRKKRNDYDGLYIFDGSGISLDNEEYGVDNYMSFVSNGMTNNERIDAVDYYDEFLDENNIFDDEY